MRNNNGAIVRKLLRRSFNTNKVRNMIAVLAIALTTVLFTTLFTIGMSIGYAFEQANFRQIGGYSHGDFKYISMEQIQELRDDPLIKAYGLRLFVGMPLEQPFNKTQVEISYADANTAKWMYMNPVKGRLPAEGTSEAATDTRVLSLLNIEPKPGAEFTMTFDVDGTPTTQTFTLSGWWEYDAASPASFVQIPESRAQSIFSKLGTQSLDGMTATWSMDVMFGSSLNIEKDVEAVLANHGYQNESNGVENYIATGVNWGYTGAQLMNSLDPGMALAMAALILVIIFTGYLVIYNVFQISVSNDVRFYGLLKTVGTSGRQLRRLIWLQALSLSLIGIPLGLLGGYLLGVKLTPVVLSRLNGVVLDAVSASPWIFLFSAMFSLVTVLISCRKPGRMAAKVSPVEALRYTGASSGKKKARRWHKGTSLPRMAVANMGRNRRKTTITILSLSLAVVLLNLTYTFTNGFDMDKYLSKMASDFIVSDAGYFKVGGELWNMEMALPEEVIAGIKEQGGAADGGRTYGQTSWVQEFVDEARVRARLGRYNDEETVNRYISFAEKLPNGKISESVQLFGMEQYVLDKLEVIEGDIAKLSEPGYIAAVYMEDDYGVPRMNSHWAKLGETVTLRYADESEYYNPENGVMYGNVPPETEAYRRRAKIYRDMEYEVAALVTVPHALGYRYYGIDRFVMSAGAFIRDTGTNAVMYYAFDATDEGNALIEAFLSDFTGSRAIEYDYESKATYAKEFESFRSMFLMLGGALCFIVGLVGVLNFIGAILTGIITRRLEFAMLQAIGMTGRQLKTMLICEGLFNTMGAVVFSLALFLATGPLLESVMGGMFWFFTYRFSVLPLLVAAPVFALLGVVIPLTSYHFSCKRSVVERLREGE